MRQYTGFACPLSHITIHLLLGVHGVQVEVIASLRGSLPQFPRQGVQLLARESGFWLVISSLSMFFVFVLHVAHWLCLNRRSVPG